jgi:hypothetical protein
VRRRRSGNASSSRARTIAAPRARRTSPALGRALTTGQAQLLPGRPTPRATVRLVLGRMSCAGAMLLVSLVAFTIPVGCLPENYVCDGEESPCGALDQVSCTSDSNGHCSWGSGCETPCIGLGPSECQAGRPNVCASYDQQCFPLEIDECMEFDQSDCAAQPNCEWATRCRGDLQCPELQGEAQCNRHLGCSWQPANL